MHSILSYFADLTGTKRRSGPRGGEPKSPEQIQFERTLNTAMVHRKNPATEEELEQGARPKTTTPVKVGEAFKDKDYIVVYYSASWCPPCRGFTPQLRGWYERNHNNSGKTFEVVLVSWDNSWRDFANYFKKMPMEWLAIPPTDANAIKLLNAKHNIRGIPALVVIDTKNNKVVSTNGRDLVSKDYYGTMFPWDAESIKNSTFMGRYFPSAAEGFSPADISYETVVRTGLTVGGGLAGLFIYRNMRSRAAWNGFKERLATRLNNAAQNGGRH